MSEKQTRILSMLGAATVGALRARDLVDAEDIVTVLIDTADRYNLNIDTDDSAIGAPAIHPTPSSSAGQ